MGNWPIAVAPLLFLCQTGCTPEFGNASRDPQVTIDIVHTGTSARFIGLSVVDQNVAWAGGSEGTFARTTDGGKNWLVSQVPEARNLQFRDVHALDARTAFLLSAGQGEASRIYKTSDGGDSWKLQFVNPEPEGFFDCMDFWDERSGLAFSDSVNGAFLVVLTSDGGETWQRVPAQDLPTALTDEGGFAASGTCLRTAAPATAWFGTGNSTTARVVQTRDRGKTWSVSATPLRAGTGAGITSLVFLNDKDGFAFGGNVSETDLRGQNLALTLDGGTSWQPVAQSTLPAIYGAAAFQWGEVPGLVAVGPRGAFYSVDRGRNWTQFSESDFWSVAMADATLGWAVGPEGRIARIEFQ